MRITRGKSEATTILTLGVKVLVHDGIGIWLAARRLHQGRFVWPTPGAAERLSLSRAQLDALVLGLPWARIGEAGIIAIT